MRVAIVAAPGAGTAFAWLEAGSGAVSPARKMPEGFAAAPEQDRDAVLRTAARDFAMAYGYRVCGEFTPAEGPAPDGGGGPPMRGWAAPIARDPDAE